MTSDSRNKGNGPQTGAVGPADEPPAGDSESYTPLTGVLGADPARLLDDEEVEELEARKTKARRLWAKKGSLS